MKNLFQKLVTCMVASTLVMGMSGCGSTSQTSSVDKAESSTAQVEDSKEQKEESTAVEEYMNENPNVTINTQTLDTEAYKTKISAEFAGDASGIDVFYY